MPLDKGFVPLIATSSPELRQAVEALWHAGKLAPGNLYTAPAFVHLRQVCQTAYPGAGSKQSQDFALSTALANLGFRWTSDDPSHGALAAGIAADRIDQAFRQTVSHRVHLCPLDQADELPALRFGPNSVRSFTSDELNSLIDPDGILKQRPEWRLDAHRLSQFSWLVVNERVDLAGKSGARSLPSIFAGLHQDFGRIEPHKSRYPQAVEEALFALLTAPWEDLTKYSEWRPFRIPWVYTLDDDLFAHIPAPPSADSLTWGSDFFENDQGETIEYERPLRIPLSDDTNEKIAFLNDDAWQELVLASASPLLATPVKHFFVRAFATDGIDEFLAHIMAIEAALGLEDDYPTNKGSKLNNKKSPKQSAKGPGGSARVKARLASLLDDAGAKEHYQRLFQDRSNFIHGRTMTDIPTASRLDARRLARRCVCALIGAAIFESAPESRDAFLNDLLQRSCSPK